MSRMSFQERDVKQTNACVFIGSPQSEIQTNCEGGNRFRNFSLPYTANECIARRYLALDLSSGISLFPIDDWRPVCNFEIYHLLNRDFCSCSKHMETRAMRSSVQCEASWLIASDCLECASLAILPSNSRCFDMLGRCRSRKQNHPTK